MQYNEKWLVQTVVQYINERHLTKGPRMWKKSSKNVASIIFLSRLMHLVMFVCVVRLHEDKRM